MKELEELAKTAGAEVVAQVIQKRSAPEPATVIGEGKIEELRDLVNKLEADLVIFDCELTASRIRTFGNGKSFFFFQAPSGFPQAWLFCSLYGELGCGGIPVVNVLNKCDLMENNIPESQRFIVKY